MNLHHLAIFHGVARAGSVNAAARLLHTSQPAISRELRIR
jgi:DNA-binding transcriptional LysR family regulator